MMSRRPAVHHALTGLLVASILPGCELFDQVKDTLEGVTDPTVALGVLTRIEPPSGFDDPTLSDLTGVSGTELDPGVAATLFLADARSLSDLGNAPVTGAEILARGCEEEVLLEEAEPAYVLAPGEAFDACDASAFSFERVDEPEAVYAPVDLPAAIDLGLPDTWDAGEELVVDLSAGAYDNAIVLVVDLSDGSITYSNEPTDARGYYDVLTGGGVETVTIPGEAFPADTVVGVAVTGLLRTPNRDLDAANEVLSAVAGGRTMSHLMSTFAVLPE